MQDARENTVVCPRCGHRHPPGVKACPACGAVGEGAGAGADDSSEWSRTRDSLKTKWVASVLAFWVSVAVLGAVFFIDGDLNLVLVSIALGMLVIGVWLKSRYLLHLRKEPGRH